MNQTERKIPMELKAKIEALLSEILSDKHDCVVRIRFEKKVTA